MPKDRLKVPLKPIHDSEDIEVRYEGRPRGSTPHQVRLQERLGIRRQDADEEGAVATLRDQ